MELQDARADICLEARSFRLGQPKRYGPRTGVLGRPLSLRVASARNGQRQRALASLFIFISVMRYAWLPKF